MSTDNIISFNGSSPAAQKAVEKINAEMQKNSTDAYIEIIGTYVIDRFSASSPGGGRSDVEAVAEKAAEGKKTLQGALDAVKAAARKAAKGNCAVMLPKDVFGEVDKYFGFSTDTEVQQKTLFAFSPYGGESNKVTAPPPPPTPPAGGLSMSLSDFL